MQCAYSLLQSSQALPPDTEERNDRLWLKFLEVGEGEKPMYFSRFPGEAVPLGKVQTRKKAKLLAQPLPS